MSRRRDVRRVKDHSTYTASELSVSLSVGLSTITRWRKEGLREIDEHLPYLYSGKAVTAFLLRKNKPRQPLANGEIYCVACKRPSTPAAGLVFVQPRGTTTVDLIGVCVSCDRPIYRRVRRAELCERSGGLHLRYKDEGDALARDEEPPHMEHLGEGRR